MGDDHKGRVAPQRLNLTCSVGVAIYSYPVD